MFHESLPAQTVVHALNRWCFYLNMAETSDPNQLKPRPSRRSSVESSASEIEEYGEEYQSTFTPREHKFETVDFRVPASKVNLDKYFPKSGSELRSYNLIAALMGILVGVAIGIVGFIVDQLVRGVTILVYLPTDYFLKLQTKISFVAAVCFYMLLSCIAVLVACMLVLFVAAKGAGSGIPELKAYLNGVRVPGYLSLQTLAVKSIGVAFSIGGGLICGKQGPMIHAGAIIGAGLSQGTSAFFKFRIRSDKFVKSLRFLRTNAWKRDFTAVGAAVGVAVAFGAPMGGWVWVYEEACTHWSWLLGLITLGGCISGVITVGLLNYFAMGLPNGGIANFTLTNFGKLYSGAAGRMLFPLEDVPMYIVIGIFGGVIGAVLPLVNKHITLFRYKHGERAFRASEVILIAALTSVLRIVIPKFANDCAPINQSLVDSLPRELDYSRFNCPDGQYSAWAATFFNPTSEIVRGLLFADDSKVFPLVPLAVSFLVFYCFVVWTYGVAVPAGVFFPGFLVGTIYGRFFGVLMLTMFPSRTNVSMSAYAFLGAVSALAGITRTISVAIVALEATAKGEAFFGSIIVSVIAKIVADRLFSLGIYDLHISLSGMPYLPEVIPNLEWYNQVRVRNLKVLPVGVRKLVTVKEILRILGNCNHHSFPVFQKMRNVKRSGVILTEVRRDIFGDEEDGLGHTPHSIHHPSEILQFDGTVQILKIDERGRVDLDPYEGAPPTNGEMTELSSNENKDEVEFGVSGMITRDVLLAVLELKLDAILSDVGGSDVQHNEDKSLPRPLDDDVVKRDKLDSAWPNSLREKNEYDLRRRAKENLDETSVVNLGPYIDPNPLLIAGRAYSTAAYHLLRSTGARHMLVANLRKGHVEGILTRKDILLQSVEEKVQFKGTKIE